MTRVAAVLLLACLMPAGVLAQQAPPDEAPARFGIVFSSQMLTDVHENDAKAALKAWAEALVRERNIRAEPDPHVLDGVPAFEEALRSGIADVITLTTNEYLTLEINPAPTRFFASVIGGETVEEYLLLVHRDSTIDDLRGLEGRTMVLFENSRTALAPFWLDTILLQSELPPADRHFSRMNGVTKLSGAILPVFFGQADACVVTRRGLGVMTELNPQVGTQLRVLATSPGFVPSVGFVQPASEDLFGEIDLLEEISLLHTSAAGRQILNLFQAEEIQTVPPSELDEARQLLATHQRLMAEWETGSKQRNAPTTESKISSSVSTGGVQ